MTGYVISDREQEPALRLLFYDILLDCINRFDWMDNRVANAIDCLDWMTRYRVQPCCNIYRSEVAKQGVLCTPIAVSRPW